MKENLSLDELAQMFSPNLTELNLNKEELIKRNIVSHEVIHFYLENNEGGIQFDLGRMVEVLYSRKITSIR